MSAASAPPLTLPRIDAAVTTEARRQSMLACPAWTRKLESELMVITSSEVPTAVRIGSPPRRTSAGTTRKPPPAPTRPVMKPTRAPWAMNPGARRGPRPLGASAGSSSRPRSIAPAVASITAAKARSKRPAGTWRATCPPAKPPAAPARPKESPSRHATRPARAWATVATALVAPITRSDVAMALLASSPRTYTRSGTVRMEPPPPSAPSVKPMGKDKSPPMTSVPIMALASREEGFVDERRSAQAAPVRRRRRERRAGGRGRRPDWRAPLRGSSWAEGDRASS
ncbi:uncharacterized protein SOCEGT47_085130 [Sorangium cellulosum]|uniref:Uncharacterized protein n=1 Tax=Sorangium cellulosum TaxID=56 RepID=A0A4P2QFD4_SORCE|nr:uncharacterized protein SOCEGT47_085130 [Sorangium cellulosum]